MNELIPYCFSYSSFSSIVHRYKLLNEVENLNELEKKITPLLKAKELSNIQIAANQVKLETEKRGIQIIDYYHPNYPDLLKKIDKPPIVLFCKGNINLLKHDLVSVVGTRKPTHKANLAACLLPDMLKKSGNLGIVSGVAIGIDRTVMIAALKSGVPTIGVIGTGMETEYPFQNRDLYSMLKNSDNGLLISEMRIGEAIGKWSFPKRNRIISGIARLLILMEAPLKSGAISSVNHALEQGREVLVFDDPDLLYNEGGRKLIEDGASKITMSELENSPNSFFHISEIIPKNYNDMPSLFSSLSQMENEGLFQNLGGGYYRKLHSA